MLHAWWRVQPSPAKRASANDMKYMPNEMSSPVSVLLLLFQSKCIKNANTQVCMCVCVRESTRHLPVVQDFNSNLNKIMGIHLYFVSDKSIALFAITAVERAREIWPETLIHSFDFSSDFKNTLLKPYTQYTLCV